VFADHWLAIACLAAASALGGWTIALRYRDGDWPWTCYLPALIFASYGIGAFGFLPAWWFGPMLTTIPLAALVTAILAVFLTGAWSSARGHGLTVVLFFGLGDWTAKPVAEGLRLASLFLVSLRAHEPWWLLLLLAIPVLLWASFRNLVTLGPTRRGTVLVLRSSLVAFVAFALAETYGRTPNEGVTVIFLWDRSLSIPRQIDRGEDQREQRMIQFINQSVALRGPDHANDRVGVVVFGKHAHLELPPGRVNKLNFSAVRSNVDNTYTDIEAAMKLALASLPSDSGGRLVIISDFNENRGRAIDQARLAKQNGIQVDVLPIEAGRQAQNEILVERIEAPRLTEKGAQLPLRVVVRSFHPQVVVARLDVRKITFDPQRDLHDDQARNSTIVKLRQGLQVFSLQETASKDESAFAYEAKVTPLRVETPDGALVHNDLPGDRGENNLARVVVMSRGQRSVLVLEDRPDKMEQIVTHKLLVDRLRASHVGMKVDVMTPQQLRSITKGDAEALATVLTKYDAIFLANIPAEFLNDEEQKVIRSHVHDQGAGLVMIGGHQSFGAGGWQNTEIEKALPVNMDLKSMKVDGKSGLVLIMHAS
ncbi:MAG: VWA domain-containing protein, partial [Planctomycetes bacterium]|nr:VWA domain-containing protein [Planctomycetota bacterium]